MGARSWRTVGALGGLLGLVGVVAVAAAGRSPGGGRSGPSAHPPTLVADYLLSTMVLVMILGVGLFVYVQLVFRTQSPTGAVKRRRGYRSFIVLAVSLIVTVALARHGLPPWISRDHSHAAQPAHVVTKKAKKKTIPPAKPEPYRPQFRWLPVFVIGSLILGIGGAMTVTTLRRRREVLLDTPIALALSDVLAESLDDLRNEPDSRKAVIRAYARMERTLAAHGLPRHETEAPLEYMTRVLDAVQASSHSVRRLTHLFERARFSTHEIGAGMKEDAIAALTGLRAELEVSR